MFICRAWNNFQIYPENISDWNQIWSENFKFDPNLFYFSSIPSVG